MLNKQADQSELFQSGQVRVWLWGRVLHSVCGAAHPTALVRLIFEAEG